MTYGIYFATPQVALNPLEVGHCLPHLNLRLHSKALLI